MKRFISVIMAVAALAAMASNASAAIRTVRLTGSADFLGAGGINAAVAAAANGDEIQVLEAGTYSTVTLRGGKSYEIKGMVNGVVISNSTSLGSNVVQTSGSVSGALNARLTNLTINRVSNSTGNNAALRINQIATGTSVTLTSCNLRNLVTLDATGGEALVINGGSAASPTNVIATLCTFDSLSSGSNARHGFQVQGTASSGNIANLAGLRIDLTSCTVFSQSGNALNFNAGVNNAVVTVKNSRLESDLLGGFAGNRAAFRIGNNFRMQNCNFTFQDSVLRAPGEVAIWHNSNTTVGSSLNNVFNFNRSSLDSRRFNNFKGHTSTAGNTPGGVRELIRPRYQGVATTAIATATPFNTVNVTNCLMLGHSGFSTQTATAYIRPGGNVNVNVYHNTFWSEGAIASTTATQGTPVSYALGVGFQGPTTATAHNTVENTSFDSAFAMSRFRVANNIFANFRGIMPPGASTARGNVLGSSVDDPDAGADRTFATLASLNLSAPSWKIGTGSSAINQAVTSDTVLAAIGYVDRAKAPRWTSNAPHDSGANELIVGVPVELSEFKIE